LSAAECTADHPGHSGNAFDLGYGPYWVADIINAIGNATTCDSAGYWNDTAVFVTWDDWGGFYDHVPPPAVLYGTGTPSKFTCDQTVDDNTFMFTYQWGCGNVYGFRVPLLVVSASTQAGYVSGSIAGLNNVSYPPPPQYTHDFGSILDFVENNFSQQELGPIAPSGYSYADQNSIDYNWCQLQVPKCVPLADFFQGSQPVFNSIPVPTGYDSCEFQCYYGNIGTYENCVCGGGGGRSPMGPDEGADDN
jgi:hypothetical protein